MLFRTCICGLAVLIAGYCLPALAEGEAVEPSKQTTTVDAGAEKDAFDSAKELGTADAWNAFLTSYPTGFRADLARAYLKKVSGDTPASTQTAVPPVAGVAKEISCSERKGIRSLNSDAPTSVTFVNKSGAYRSIHWITTTGATQDYGGVNSGDEVTYNTFVSHPWMIATGPGDCLQIFMPDASPARVELIRLAADDVDDTPKPKAKKKVADDDEEDEPRRAKKKIVEKKKPLNCAPNWKEQNGRCVLQQNCGANAFRSEEGDCYCAKNYTMKNGKCVWPHDKNGFEIAPEKKSGCKGLQQRCNQGDGKACQKYEERCQVN